MDYISEKIKTGGLFSGSIKVAYLIRAVRESGDSEEKQIEMRREDTGAEVGRLEYDRQGDTARLRTIQATDWSNPVFASRLLKKFISSMKKKRVRTIHAEVYQTDDAAQARINILKANGFRIERGGNITGYNQYFFTLKLK